MDRGRRKSLVRLIKKLFSPSSNRLRHPDNVFSTQMQAKCLIDGLLTEFWYFHSLNVSTHVNRIFPYFAVRLIKFV